MVPPWSIDKKIGQPQGFHTKIGNLELFLKFKLSLARALSSDTSDISLELAALIPNFATFLKLLF